MVRLDKTDFKILYNLDYDARIPITELSKKVRLSKQNLNYRLNRLIKEKVILGFMSVIDIHHLGYLTYRLYVRYKNVDGKKEREIIEYFKEHNNVLWFVSISGPWDLEIVFVARNFIHFNNILKEIREDLGEYFSKYNYSSSIFNYHFKRDYLLDKRREELTPKYYGFEPKKEKLDQLDAKILVELSKNCRQSNLEMAKKLRVTYHTIKNRIRLMEKNKIIQSHRIFIDLSKIGRKYYKALLKLDNPTREDEKKLYSFCARQNIVVYLVEVLGEWQLEVEAEVKDQEEFINLLREIRNNFSDIIRDYEVLQVIKEHKLNYLPMGTKILEFQE